MNGRIWVALGAVSAVLAAARPTQAAAPACDDAAAVAEHKLRAAATDAAYADAQAAVANALPHCEANVSLRYLKLRMDELGANTNERELRAAVADFPRDVRIATLLARHTRLRADAEKRGRALDAAMRPRRSRWPTFTSAQTS